MTGTAELKIFAPRSDEPAIPGPVPPEGPVSAVPAAPAATPETTDSDGGREIPGLSSRALEMLDVLNELFDSLDGSPHDAQVR